jgi:ribosome-associated translation inhibitor RaiA
MNIQFRIDGFHAEAGLHARLDQHLRQLESLIPITSAEIIIEHQRYDAPAFEVNVYLAVPGPDIHGVAYDQTLEAAWLKVLKSLEQQIEESKSKRTTRARSNGHKPESLSRKSGVVAGHRG